MERIESRALNTPFDAVRIHAWATHEVARFATKIEQARTEYERLMKSRGVRVGGGKTERVVGAAVAGRAFAEEVREGEMVNGVERVGDAVLERELRASVDRLVAEMVGNGDWEVGEETEPSPMPRISEGSKRRLQVGVAPIATAQFADVEVEGEEGEMVARDSGSDLWGRYWLAYPEGGQWIASSLVETSTADIVVVDDDRKVDDPGTSVEDAYVKAASDIGMVAYRGDRANASGKREFYKSRFVEHL